MSAAYPPGSRDLRCPHCGAGTGSQCRTASGLRASAAHAARLVPRYRCPTCDEVTTEATNVRARYCARCRTWSGDGHAPGQDALELGELTPPRQTRGRL